MAKKFLYIDSWGGEVEANAFEESDFVEVSGGVGDAGKPIKLNAAGKLEASVFDFGVIDHDLLDNFEAVEHIDWTLDAAPSDIHDDNIPNAILVNGTRDFTAVVSYDADKTITNDLNLVHRGWVLDQLASAGDASEWQDSCIDILLTPPGSPSTGDRYLINDVGTGAWAGHDYEIAEWNGTAWGFTACTTGTYVSVDDEQDGFYFFGGTGPWVKHYHENTTASLGAKKVGNDIQADLLASGGLALDTNSLYVDVDELTGDGIKTVGTAPLKNLAVDVPAIVDTEYGLEVVSDDIRVKLESDGGLAFDATNFGVEVKPDATTGATVAPVAVGANGVGVQVDNDTLVHTAGVLSIPADAIDDTLIDWGTGANQVSAVDIPIADAGGLTDETEVESVLQELLQKTEHVGTTFNVDTGETVSLGDLLAPTGAYEVSPLDVTAAQVGIGLSDRAAGAGNPVIALPNGTIITGVLSGATPGQKYFWNGTGHQSSMPSASGRYVWLTAVAVNATDAMVMVEFIKRNA